MTVRILATGGTFDKRYDPVAGSLAFGSTAIGEILTPAQVTIPVEVLMQIDSLEMTDEHRRQIADACERSPQTRIVIVHGTDTMLETAATVAARNLAATVVLTGAMVPNAVRDSDAAFNLGFALAAATLAEAGVWIAMHARLHDWQLVRKNRALGRFEPHAPAD